MKHAIWDICILLEALFYIRNGAFSIEFDKSNRVADNNVIKSHQMFSATMTNSTTTTKTAEAIATPPHKQLLK